jgi:hypothetical protein
MKTERKTAQRLLIPLLVLIVGIVFSSCYEDYGLTVADYDTQLTHYAAGANFQQYKYFVMPDTIVHMYDTTKADPMKDFRKFDDQILGLTASNLEGRGYQRITAADTVGKSATTMVVFLTQMTQSYVGYYYDYWYGYWGWYYPGYYPGYYPPAYATTYEYSTGTIITTIIDLGQTLAQHKITPVWNGLVTGLTGSSSTVPTRLTDGINKLYEQSPYLYASQP